MHCVGEKNLIVHNQTRKVYCSNWKEESEGVRLENQDLRQGRYDAAGLC